jgi:hypothetical protein
LEAESPQWAAGFNENTAAEYSFSLEGRGHLPKIVFSSLIYLGVPEPFQTPQVTLSEYFSRMRSNLKRLPILKLMPM